MRPIIEQGKIVKMTNVITGEERYFSSLNKAAKATGVKQSNLSLYARGFGNALGGWKVELISKEAVDMNKVEF